MRIVDAQIHIWGSGLPSNMAHRQVTAFTTEEAIGLMDEGGVDAAVIHPPGWDPNSTAMAFEAVRTYPGRFAIMGACSAGRAGQARARSRPGGTSRACSVCATGSCRSRCGAGWRMARSTGSGPPPSRPACRSRCWRRTRCRHIGRIAERHPGLRLTIDHLGGRGGNTTLKDAAAMDPHAGAAGAGEAPQRGRQGDRRARLLERAVSVPDHAPVPAADLRRLRAAADVLGHRHHEDAVLLAAVRDDVHRGAAVAVRAGSRSSSWARRVCAWWGWDQTG